MSRLNRLLLTVHLALAFFWDPDRFLVALGHLLKLDKGDNPTAAFCRSATRFDSIGLYDLSRLYAGCAAVGSFRFMPKSLAAQTSGMLLNCCTPNAAR